MCSYHQQKYVDTLLNQLQPQPSDSLLLLTMVRRLRYVREITERKRGIEQIHKVISYLIDLIHVVCLLWSLSSDYEEYTSKITVKKRKKQIFWSFATTISVYGRYKLFSPFSHLHSFFIFDNCIEKNREILIGSPTGR